MNQALAAHQRLIASTPRERIRTHERRYVEERPVVTLAQPPRVLSVKKQETIMAMIHSGKTQREASRALGMAESTVSKFVNRYKASKRGI